MTRGTLLLRGYGMRNRIEIETSEIWRKMFGKHAVSLKRSHVHMTIALCFFVLNCNISQGQEYSNGYGYLEIVNGHVR